MPAKTRITQKPPSRLPVLVVVLVFAAVLTLILLMSRASTPVPVGSPQATVDTAVIYSTKQDGETNQIWKMNTNGTSKVKLTNDQTAEHEWARPSPDGKSILFTKADKGSTVNFALTSNRLWVMNADGTNQREIISIAKRNSYGWSGMGHAEWSPDSSKIVLAVTLPNLTSQLFVVDANGNNREQITKTIQIDGQNTLVSDPSWSKTNQIMFTRAWNCLFVCSYQDVFRMDYTTRQETRVTNDPQWNYDPYMSPDGTTYLWLSFRSSNISCPCDLIRGNVTGPLNPTPVIADGGANANGTFSSDSTTILFLKQVGLKQVLHRINRDGTGLTPLTPSASGESGIASYIPQSSSASTTISPVSPSAAATTSTTITPTTSSPAAKW